MRRRTERRRPHRTPPGTLALGSGRVASEGMGSKAALLDEAHRRGVAVPLGFVLPPEVDPTGLEPFLAAAGCATVAVRSAFLVEDGTHDSHAGWFLTRLRVPAQQYVDAVAQVRASAEVRGVPGRRDVLVMAMVEAHHAGVAFSEPGTYDDVVNVVAGTAEGLVGGEVEGQRRLLPRLERAEAGWPRRLQQLLRQVRKHFGDTAWDLEWADDGRKCWLLQLRPVTRPTRRDEALTIANHAEILPPLPSVFMTHVIAEAGPALFEWYRRADPTLPADRAFLEVVAGRPFINLSLLEDMLRHLGLPTRLVADSIGGPPEREVPLRPLRMLRRAPALMRLGWAQVHAVTTAPRLRRRVATVGQAPAVSFTDQVERLRGAYVDLVTGMFPLSSAIGPPLAVLRRTGTLLEHASQHRTVTTEMAQALDAARTAGPDSEAWQHFLHEFGHRGIYESDIARPRYRDDASWLHGDRSAPQAPRKRSRRRLRTRLTAPVWMLARAPLAAREELRHAAMRGFADLRDGFVALANRAVDRGLLPSVDHLWQLTTDEVRSLDEGWRPESAFWSARFEEQQRLARLHPPPVVHRFDDPSEWSPEALEPTARLKGLSLTDGVIRGRVWVLQEPERSLPDGFRPEETLLVARSVDAGWIPTFALVAGVIVETGGDLSHGSILLRERGVPAITNVRGATRVAVTGEEWELRAGSGVAVRVSDAS
jgi:rifampicin phosphotransferase